MVLHDRHPPTTTARLRVLRFPHPTEAVKFTDDSTRRYPLCPLAHRLPAHRRRPHRAVQLALCQAPSAARCCCASRTPTASARPSRRSTAILDGLQWLGLAWDGDVVYQFARAARHREVAEQLLAEGKAYHCYATPRSSRRCARKRAPRASRCAMTAAGATAIPPRRPPA